MCGIQHTLPTGRDTCVVYSTHCPQGGIRVRHTAHTVHKEGYMCGIQHTLPTRRDTCAAYSTHCPQGGIHVQYTAQQAHTHTVFTYVCTYIHTYAHHVCTHAHTHTHTCTHLLHWCTLVLLQCKEEGSFYTKSSSTQDSITAPSVSLAVSEAAAPPTRVMACKADLYSRIVTKQLYTCKYIHSNRLHNSDACGG